MSDQSRDILQAVGRRLDDTRDLLDAAVEQTTSLERSLRGHEYAVNDLHWDAAKILLDPDENRPTVRTVQTGAEHLAEQLHHSHHAATQIHDTLEAAGQELHHADRLIDALAGASETVDHAAEVGILSGRAARLNALVELATPLADRASQQLRHAADVLEREVTFSTGPGGDQFQVFWSIDRGVFDTAREIAHARTSTRDGTELTEHAVHSGTLTAAHIRGLLRRPQQSGPSPAPNTGGPPGPAL